MNSGLMIPGDSFARGRWAFDARGPLSVSDPEQFRALLGLSPRPSVGRGQKMLEDCIVPWSITDFLRRMADEDRRRAERLLSGGDRLWRVDQCNIVVNEGLTNILDVYFSAATQDTTWFIGLTDGTPTVAAADTLASHAGWVEITAYDQAGRVAFVDAGAASQSISNSASPASFTINATTTTGGGFMAGVTSGTAGILYAAAAFTGGDKTLNDNDTLAVTATFTMAAA